MRLLAIFLIFFLIDAQAKTCAQYQLKGTIVRQDGNFYLLQNQQTKSEKIFSIAPQLTLDVIAILNQYAEIEASVEEQTHSLDKITHIIQIKNLLYKIEEEQDTAKRIKELKCQP